MYYVCVYPFRSINFVASQAPAQNTANQLIQAPRYKMSQTLRQEYRRRKENSFREVFVFSPNQKVPTDEACMAHSCLSIRQSMRLTRVDSQTHVIIPGKGKLWERVSPFPSPPLQSKHNTERSNKTPQGDNACAYGGGCAVALAGSLGELLGAARDADLVSVGGSRGQLGRGGGGRRRARQGQGERDGAVGARGAIELAVFDDCQFAARGRGRGREVELVGLFCYGDGLDGNQTLLARRRCQLMNQLFN